MTSDQSQITRKSRHTVTVSHKPQATRHSQVTTQGEGEWGKVGRGSGRGGEWGVGLSTGLWQYVRRAPERQSRLRRRPGDLVRR